MDNLRDVIDITFNSYYYHIRLYNNVLKKNNLKVLDNYMQKGYNYYPKALFLMDDFYYKGAVLRAKDFGNDNANPNIYNISESGENLRDKNFLNNENNVLTNNNLFFNFSGNLVSKVNRPITTFTFIINENETIFIKNKGKIPQPGDILTKSNFLQTKIELKNNFSLRIDLNFSYMILLNYEN